MATKSSHPTVFLYWIFTPLLCKNIVREVHSYLDGPYLYHFHLNDITIYDSALGITMKYRYPYIIPYTISAIPVVISKSKVFITGAGTGTEVSNCKKTYLMQIYRPMERLEDAIYPGLPGLFYHQNGNYVVAFGGGSAKRPRNDIQVFYLYTGKWTVLSGKMVHPRCNFTPCEYHSAVYLISGNVPFIERFSIKTSVSTVVGQLSTPLPGSFSLFPYDECMYILFNHACLIYNLKKSYSYYLVSFPDHLPQSINYAILNDNLILVGKSSLFSLNIRKLTPLSWIKCEFWVFFLYLCNVVVLVIYLKPYTYTEIMVTFLIDLTMLILIVNLN